ncbi:9-O-acetylesterase [Bacteroidia bacterium]|nr:9-O-acetylesterase [Bacteroidia bacterium]
MKKLILVPALLLAFLAEGKVRLPALFGDNMVLQQQTSVRIWGWGDKGKTIVVTPSWSKTSAKTIVDPDGRWALHVNTPAAKAGASYTLTVSDGGQATTIGNVLVGEVWICSGQSNMEMRLSGNNGQPVRGSMQEVLASSRYGDLIRTIDVPNKGSDTPVDDFEGRWLAASPSTAAGFSATAWFFARNIVDATGIPVGIVRSDWGGTRIEAWMDEASVARVETPAQVEALRKSKAMAKLYNGMINPIAGYAARGFLWYQGEANRSNYGDYAALMKEMVALWRNRWDDKSDSMPFYYVQIAPYSYGVKNDTRSGLLVEAQVKAMSLIPNSALAATNDAGEEFCIHPAAKDLVGLRLALLALVRDYRVLKIDTMGPLFKAVSYDKNVAKVTFTNASTGLFCQGREAQGFEIAGEDRVFYPARAEIKDQAGAVHLTSDKVAQPVAVRYAFRNFIPADLQNSWGLPAFPFRTDDWDDVK